MTGGVGWSPEWIWMGSIRYSLQLKGLTGEEVQY